MSRHAMTTPADSSDPMQETGDTAGTALQSMSRDGSEAISGVGNFVGRLVYTTSYTVSYGVVFPTMLIVRAVPKDNALVHGLIDGALAARDQLSGWGDGHAEMAELDGAESESDGEHHESDGSTGHRRGGRRHRGGRGSSHSSREV